MKKLVRRIFAQVMFSSFYTHIVLVISILIFLFSYYSYLQRVPTNRHSIPSTAPKLSRTRSTETNVTDDDSLLFTIGARTSDVTTDEEPVRRRVLGTHRGKSSPLSRFTFINPPKPVCNYPKDPSKMMVIVVLSRGLNFDYRQVIRATWGRSGKYSSSDISVQTVFFVGTDDSVQGAVRHEQVTFNDVVEIGIPENYPFVAHKELAALLWTRYYCPSARIIYRADDDILLDIFLLLSHVEHHIHFDTHDGLYGWFRFNNTVHREDKWAVTKVEYQPSIYPPYTFGIGYLFSNVSCQRLIDAANHPNHQIIRIGDVYITGILRELAKIPFYDFENLQYAYTFYTEIPCEEYFESKPDLLLCMSKLHIGQRGDPYQFYDAWDIILARQNMSLTQIGV